MAAKERKRKPGVELETETEQRDVNRREHEVMLQKEANQDVQTGTNDARHPGIKWGASYETRRKPKRKQRPDDNRNPKKNWSSRP